MLSRASWNLAGQIRLVSEYYQQTNFEANSKSQTKRQSDAYNKKKFKEK